MGIVYTPGQTLTRGDLDIFLRGASGVVANAADIYYTLFYVDPGPPETEVRIGDEHRIPMNPQVGEYYASLMVPPSATVGTYRIKWTFKETSSSPWQQVAQEFAVVSTSTSVTPPSSFSPAQIQMIWSLRVLLRDQCVGGEEEVELDVGGERMIVRMDDLWEALSDLSPSRQFQQRDKLRESFLAGNLTTRSVSPEGKMEWKRIVSTNRAEVPWETICKGTTAKGPFVLTAGHRVFIGPTEKLSMQEIGESGTGTLMLCVSGEGETSVNDGLVFGEDPNVGYIMLREWGRLESRQFMYDMTVEDWHNFVLLHSGVVVSNSPDKFYHFRPPEFEGDIGEYNRIFGQIWEDDELLEYLSRSLDWFNMLPPNTGPALPSIDALVNMKPQWRTAILWGAIVHACFALSLNWVADEFSIRGDQSVRVILSDKTELDIPIRELYEVCKDAD